LCIRIKASGILMNNERKTSRIVPVILAGGSGTRLWPLSRSQYPKQFLPLLNEESLLVATCRRVADATRFSAPIVICSSGHQSVLTQQLCDAGITPQVLVLEPVARGTAAAAAVAANLVGRASPDDVLLLLAADNHIRDSGAFLAAIEAGMPAAMTGRIVVFGEKPTRPETGFGYIEVGGSIEGVDSVPLVIGFVEKPDRPLAEAFITSGRYLWNSGNFLLRAGTLLEEFQRLQPTILASCERALNRAAGQAGVLFLDEAALEAMPSESFDRAIMEHTDRAAVVPIDAGWSDVGSWDALWAASRRDMNGNSLIGDTIVSDAVGSYIRSEGRLVAAVGVTDLVIVETSDAVFIAPRDRAVEAKAMVERLQKLGRPEVRAHAKVSERWGSARTIDEGDRFLARHVIVHPGARLTRQIDHDRAEHWMITQGVACITQGDESKWLHEGESMRIAAGSYSLENRELTPLHLIEIRTVSGLGDDGGFRTALPELRELRRGNSY
jgi:mannose-1-phosphate guanylyltransferase / mannose-6-phosphate isomerase